MSKGNVQGFYDSIKENEELNKALLVAVAAGNVVAYAKGKGYEFTQAEHDEFMAVIAEGMTKLPDDQLEEVSGGFHIPTPQCRICCDQCDFKTRWYLDPAYQAAVTEFAYHTATRAHVNFHAQHKLR